MGKTTSNKSILLKQLIKEKILVLDGAMGTMIQDADLSAKDFGGADYEGCNEMLNLTRPDLIQKIHQEYLEAGADIIETNTFGANAIVLAEYGLEDKTEEINLAAVKLAKNAAEKYKNNISDKFIAGAIGPTTKALSVTGGISFEQMEEAYYQQARALIMGGVDLLLLETAQDTLNVKAGGVGIKRAFSELGFEVPIMISGTIETTGTTLAGQNIEAFYISLEHLNPISMGLNCATGPELMRDHLRTLSGLASSGVSCYPNAGLPDENGCYHESPKEFALKMADFAKQGWLNIAGGCCGTTPEHIKLLAEELKTVNPRTVNIKTLPAVSGIEPLYLEEDNRPILVGERTNVIGSKKFRDLIAGGKYEEASEIARAQVKGGAQVIDICLANPDRNELDDMERFLEFAVKKVKVPLMIDSTDSEVIEKSLKYLQGKAIINSINLEDGEKRFEEIVSLIHQYGAAVVVGLIDEKGMAVSRERKLSTAKRAYNLLVSKYNIKPENIIFDPLVFPVGTGDEDYIGSAVETIEGLRLVKKTFPKSKTILGISNVSFGLPSSGREVINAVFLYHATLAGLDYAIVNTEKLQRYPSIPEKERQMAEKLLFQTKEEYLTEFTAFYREKKTEKKVTDINLTLHERLSNYIIEGSKDGLLNDLEKALVQYLPLEIINQHLMKGMKEVGRLFNNNELIVAEVLQSAEVMKAAVTFLEPYMERKEEAAKGKILLATVKGDVHDIGKNLVDIILSNNGYDVVNLGIKISPEQLIEAFHKEKPDAIGLSGLLVKSAQQMVTTAQDLRISGIEVPLVVGGAALTRNFTEHRIAPEYNGRVLYAKDAMNGLELFNQIYENTNHQNKKITANSERVSVGENLQVGVIRKSEEKFESNRYVRHKAPPEFGNPVYQPKDLAHHLLTKYPLADLRPYLNMQRLLGKHLGLKGSVERLLSKGDNKAIELNDTVNRLLDEAEREGFIRANGIYRFFPAQSTGNDVLIFDPNNPDKVIQRFTFPRQQHEPYLCLSDFLHSVESGRIDYVGFLIVTTGHRIRQLAAQWRNQGEFLRSYLLQAVSLELAEAFAERLHQILRNDWGIDNQGIRVSFGYPACPNLEDQQKLFALLNPEGIGISLTEGFMMEPEASVSAMVFSNPDARYFKI